METFLPEEGVFHLNSGPLYRPPDIGQRENADSLRGSPPGHPPAQPFLLPQTGAGEENRRKVRLVLNPSPAKPHYCFTS